MKRTHILLASLAALLMTGCATPKGYDYAALKQSKPRSILVMPPVNSSNDIKGSNSLWSVMSLPLGEAGYYVLPVALVDETFRQNGMANAAEAAMAPPAKLRQIFGADAALYTQIKEYGTSYVVINSSTVVTAESRLVDLRSGALLWQGSATANNEDAGGTRVGGGGIVGMLVAAVVNQVIAETTDTGHKVANVTAIRLLTPTPPAGILYGPRSPNYSRQ